MENEIKIKKVKLTGDKRRIFDNMRNEKNWEIRLDALKVAESKYLDIYSIRSEVAHRALIDEATEVRSLACNICNRHNIRHKGKVIKLGKMAPLFNHKLTRGFKDNIYAILRYYIKRSEQVYTHEFIETFKERYPAQYDFIFGRMIDKGKLVQWFREKIKMFKQEETICIVNLYDKHYKKDEDVIKELV